MSSLFSGPSVPKPQAPPTIDEAAKARNEADANLKRRKGRLATIVTGPKAGTSTGGGAARALLGGS